MKHTLGLILGAVLSTSAMSFELPGLYTMDDLYQTETPIMIAHRGMGPNSGEDSTKPIENTLKSVAAAYKAGAKIVEIDAQITADGVVVAFHDDFLDDYTCLNSITYSELKDRIPSMTKLKKILNFARFKNRVHSLFNGPITGLVQIEIKTPSPLCDPMDVRGLEIVEGVVDVVQRTRMNEQVTLDSFSPELLMMAHQIAPAIKKDLAISTLQMVDEQTGQYLLSLQTPVLPYTVIDKDVLGLKWAEVGPVYRLPSYYVDENPLLTVQNLIQINFAVGSNMVSVDKEYLGFLETYVGVGQGLAFVQGLQSMGLMVNLYTAENEQEWLFGQQFGVDMITMDDIEAGVALSN